MYSIYQIPVASPEANLSKFSATLEAPRPCLIFVVVAVIEVSLNVD